MPEICPSLPCSGEKDGLIYRREVRPSDREDVRKIVAATGFFSPAETDIAVELVEETLREGDGYLFLFAEWNGNVVGYACFGPIPCTKTSYDLYWIAVDPRFQRSGVGGRLLAETEKEIFRLGGRRIYIDTSSRDQYETTRVFYRAQGYLEEALLQDFYAPGDGKIIFFKAI